MFLFLGGGKGKGGGGRGEGGRGRGEGGRGRGEGPEGVTRKFEFLSGKIVGRDSQK